MADSDQSLAGKICLVTGATDGIGKVTARVLAERGATVVMAGRNPKKMAAALEEVRKQSGNPNVSSLLADLSVMAQVRELAAQFQQQHERLDVLVNNAGAMFVRRQESVDGLEMTFALNHLSYFLLTLLLMDSLKVSPAARIVNVASAAHHQKVLDFDDLQSKRGYSGMPVYGKSKLANILFTYELARRLEGTNITANVLHPGFVATNIGADNFGFLGKLVRGIINLQAVGVEEGALTSIYLACSPEVEGVSGKYFVREKERRSSAASHDEAAARRLWAVSAELAGVSGEI